MCFGLIEFQWRKAKGLLPSSGAGIHIPCTASTALICSIRAPDVRTTFTFTAGFELIIVCSLSLKCLATLGYVCMLSARLTVASFWARPQYLLLTMVTMNTGGVKRVQDQRTRLHSWQASYLDSFLIVASGYSRKEAIVCR